MFTAPVHTQVVLLEWGKEESGGMSKNATLMGQPDRQFQNPAW
jgi:hypothetical protein